MTTSENDRFGELRSALQEPSDEGLEQADALFATLDRDATLTIPWRELRDRARWEPGWR